MSMQCVVQQQAKWQQQDQQKPAAIAIVEPNGYSAVPFSLETYRRLGQQATKLLHMLGNKAAKGSVAHASFVSGALLQRSVGLCKGNFFCASCLCGHARKHKWASLVWLFPLMSKSRSLYIAFADIFGTCDDVAEIERGLWHDVPVMLCWFVTIY
jgi:hypothetical protein